MKVVRVKLVHKWNWLVLVVAFVSGAVIGSWYGVIEPVLQWFELLIKYGI